jgi:hypothetical protein
VPLGSFFGGVKPLKTKNNVLKAKIESLFFLLNYCDTDSKARVFMKTIKIRFSKNLRKLRRLENSKALATNDASVSLGN